MTQKIGTWLWANIRGDKSAFYKYDPDKDEFNKSISVPYPEATYWNSDRMGAGNGILTVTFNCTADITTITADSMLLTADCA